MSFDPAIFGEGFHHFVQKEVALFGNNLGVFLHIFTILLLIVVFRYGNKVRRLFAGYFALNWLFLFGYWGVYATLYWFNKGIPYLAVYSLTPVLLGLIVFFWIREIIHPSLNLNIRYIPAYRYLVIIIITWGLWYPTYIYGQGFLFTSKDLLFSSYGLMPCPTTMVVLGLMTLKYPDGNMPLFRLFTVYALFIGTATVMTGWIPDIPFVVIGLYALALTIAEKKRKHYQVGQTT